jgi:hypothetical protein
MRKSDWKALGLAISVIGLIWDLARGAEHQRTCPKCVRRDYLAVALDVAHLAQTAQSPGRAARGRAI